MGIKANKAVRYETLKVRSIAQKGLREWAHLENVLDVIEEYVSHAADTLNNSPTSNTLAKRSKSASSQSSDAYSIDEIEDIAAYDACSRLLIRKDRILGDIQKGKIAKHVLWQMVTCAHNCNTSNPDLQPPWQALSVTELASQLLHPDCIPPDANVRFGYNNSHTKTEDARVFINHWADIGFLQFNKVWKNGKVSDPLPAEERWHMLRAEEESNSSADSDNEEETDSEPHTFTSLKRQTPQLGSKGSILPITIDDPAGFEEPIRDPDVRLCEEPYDRVSGCHPHDPRTPNWDAPNVVPNASWCRGQYVQQVAREVGGLEMQTILKAALALVRCPLDDNYSIPLSALDASTSAPSAPAVARWSSHRAYLESDVEAASLASFIERKPWTLRVKGSVVFSGYSQAWNVILAALTYARGRAHKDVLLSTPIPNWARSGQDAAHELARSLTFSTQSRRTIEIIDALFHYLSDLSRRLTYPGLPPSLMYSRFDSCMEYLRCLLNPVKELVDLMKVVQKMPSGSADDRPRPCVPEMEIAIARSEDIGRLWNWPRCGLPSKVHYRSEVSSLITDIESWWSSEELFFCEGSGEIQTLENGLQHLLQAGLICQELQHCHEGRKDSNGLLANSCLADEDARDSIHEILASYACRHKDRLTDALTALDGDDIELESTPDADETYDNEVIDFSHSVRELEAQIRQETAQHDRYIRTVEKSLELDALDRSRPNVNSVTRAQQNKENRQRTGMIHPPKTQEISPAAPDLSFVNEVTLPEVAPRILQGKKTRKTRKDMRVRTRPTNTPLATEEGRPSGQKASVMAAGKRKAASKSVASKAAKPPVKRRRTSTAESATSDLQESFDIYNISDHESDSGEAEEAPAKTDERPEEPGSPQQLVFDGHTSQQTPAQAETSSAATKPRPRRVVRGDPDRPAAGISTAFGDADSSTDTREVDKVIITRGRRSSIRSSKPAGPSSPGGPRTRSQSRTVRFAEAPPAASTRSKSRS